MKKTTFFIGAAALVMGYFIFSSYAGGAGAQAGMNVTGAENTTGCGASGGCHNSAANSNIAVSVELDSAGKPTTHYVGGGTYTIKITGTNKGTSTLSYFGFQISAIQGTTGSSSPVNVGTFSTNLPAGTQFTSGTANGFTADVVEQAQAISKTSGTGANGTTYVESIGFTAPAAGTGNFSIWGVLQAVTGRKGASDAWNSSHVTISEWPAHVAGIAAVNGDNKIEVKAYPNPVVNQLNLSLNNLGNEGRSLVHVFDASGKLVATQSIEATGNMQTQTIDASVWKSGLYSVVVENGAQRTHLNVVKQ